MYKVLVFLCVFCFSLLRAQDSDEQYQFLGKHFIASYKACDPEAIQNVEALIRAMRESVKQSGAQILNESSHVFLGDGLTMTFLLSESHASIHTYPEHQACFVDLFTCGDHCSYAPFDKVLRDYLKPGVVEAKLLVRDDKITEHPLAE